MKTALALLLLALAPSADAQWGRVCYPDGRCVPCGPGGVVYSIDPPTQRVYQPAQQMPRPQTERLPRNTQSVDPTIADVRVEAVISGMASGDGSGTLVDHDRGGTVVLTAHHNLAGGQRFQVTAGGKVYPAQVLGSDAQHDIALLRIPVQLDFVCIAPTQVTGRVNLQFRGYDSGAFFQVWHGEHIGYSLDAHTAMTYSVTGNSGGGVFYEGRLVGAICGGRDHKVSFAGVNSIRSLFRRVLGREPSNQCTVNVQVAATPAQEPPTKWVGSDFDRIDEITERNRKMLEECMERNRVVLERNADRSKEFAEWKAGVDKKLSSIEAPLPQIQWPTGEDLDERIDKACQDDRRKITIISERVEKIEKSFDQRFGRSFDEAIAEHRARQNSIDVVQDERLSILEERMAVIETTPADEHIAAITRQVTAAVLEEVSRPVVPPPIDPVEAPKKAEPATPSRIIFFTSTKGCPDCEPLTQDVRRLKDKGFPITVIDLDPAHYQVKGVPAFFIPDTGQRVEGLSDVRDYLATLVSPKEQEFDE